jgi:hypothetical protein
MKMNMKISKVIFVTGIILMVTAATFAQTKEQELSNAEKFSAKAGGLIQKEFVETGSVKGAKISVVYFTDLITNTKQSALKFEYESIGKYSSSTKAALLDADEVDGLIKSIKIIQEKIFPSVATNYTEVSFKSRGGFEAGCYWSKGVWSTYLKLEKYDKDSYVFLGKDDFPSLLGILEQAKTKL